MIRNVLNAMLGEHGSVRSLVVGEAPLVSTVVAALGVFANTLFGGWDAILGALGFFMVADFVLGIVAAGKAGAIDSDIMLWGGVRKLLVLGLVAIGVVLDSVLGMSDPNIRNLVIWFYIGRELLSITENYGALGFTLPPVIEHALKQIQAKSGEREG